MHRLIRYIVVGMTFVALAASVWHGPGGRLAAATLGTPTPAGCISAVKGGTPVASPIADNATPVAGNLPSITDLSSLVDAFEAQGVDVELEDSLEQPFFNAKRATRLVVSGGPLSEPAELQVYEYADADALAADIGQVTPDGNLETVIITWIAIPHFFCGDQMIVIYLGDDQAAIDLLTGLFGPQFAGW